MLCVSSVASVPEPPPQALKKAHVAKRVARDAERVGTKADFMFMGLKFAGQADLRTPRKAP
jgi:hypothetical protein